jgi:hypothetical protein
MRRVLALGLIILFGFAGIGLGQQVSGSWDIDIEIDPHQTNFSNALGVYSIIKVNYSICDWTFGSATVLDENGWVDQDFTVTGFLGPFTLTAAVDFNPDATFGSLLATTSVPFAGVVLGSQFRLQGEDTFLTLTATGNAGDLSINVSASFGDDDGACDFPFDKVTFNVGFPFCCASISSSLTIACDGFDQMSFSASGIAIPQLPWLTLAAQLVYKLDSKELTLSPTFNFAAVTCISVYVRVDTPEELTFGSVFIDGLKLTCDLGPVTFTGITFFVDTGKPSPLTGTDYWEVYTIKTNQDACCGPFSFEASIFFLENGLRLFDISLIEAGFELAISSQFTFGMELAFDVEAATIVWTLEFAIIW